MKPLRTLVARAMFGAVVALCWTVSASAADATVDLKSEEMRLIMGGTAGKGTLHYGGKDYAFTFKTASAGVGMKAVKEVSATGDVLNLVKLDDFAGKYTSVSRTAMAGSSEVQAEYENDKGVVLKLRGTVKGVGLSLGGGMAIVELVKE